jgi:hypothetical protein
MLWVGESVPWELRWHRANSLIIFQDPANFPGTRHWIDNTYETGGGNFITGYNSCAYGTGGISVLNVYRKTYPTNQS